MQDKLQIITKVKKTITYITKTLENFPNKEHILKNNIEDTFYELLKNIYKGNIHKDAFYMKEAIVNIRMIEYYTKQSLEKKILSYKKYENLGKYLLEINKMINSWIKYEKSI